MIQMEFSLKLNPLKAAAAAAWSLSQRLGLANFRNTHTACKIMTRIKHTHFFSFTSSSLVWTHHLNLINWSCAVILPPVALSGERENWNCYNCFASCVCVCVWRIDSVKAGLENSCIKFLVIKYQSVSNLEFVGRVVVVRRSNQRNLIPNKLIMVVQ